jgi:ribosome-associated protein
MNIAKTSTKSSAKSSEAPKGAQAKPRSVELLREPVELYKVLKFEGLVASGGEAKAAIDAGLVFVNDKVEMQKRKKLVNGDTVRMGDESLLLTLVEGYDPTAEPVKAKVEKPASKPAPKKDWRRKRTPAQIDADAGVVSNRKPSVPARGAKGRTARPTLGALSKKPS